MSFNIGHIYNTENNKTDYQTGQELHLDVVLNQFLSDSFAIGLQGFYLKQITGDDGRGATLGDFKAEAAGIGPALMRSRDIGKKMLPSLPSCYMNSTKCTLSPKAGHRRYDAVDCSAPSIKHSKDDSRATGRSILY